MADRLASLFDMECDRLDSHANAYEDNTHRKQLRLKLAEAQYLLNDNNQRCRSYQNSPPLSSWFVDLENIAYDVDELIDDWEQSQKSKSKIEQAVRRIHARLVRHLESFHKIFAASAISDVGFPSSDDYEINDILNSMLLNNEKTVRFIPIMDMLAMGKTLLAQKIYNHEKVKSHFQFRAWVSVGENLDPARIVEEVVVQFSKTLSIKDMLEPKELLKEKRLLLVLDDVWDEVHEKLEKLKSWLNIGGPGSCVLVTTRFSRVAELVGTVPALHSTYWPKEDSWVHSKSELTPSAYSPLLEHEKDPALMATESVVMNVPMVHLSSGSKDVMISPIPAADTKFQLAVDQLPASSMATVTEDEMICPEQTDTQPAHESEIQLIPLETGGLSAHASITMETIFDVKERSMPIRDMEFKLAVDQVPASSTETVTEDEMICPEQTDAQPGHESEIQLIPLETGGLSAHASRTVETIFDVKERVMPIPDMEFETVPSETEGEGNMKPLLNASVKQSVKPTAAVTGKLGTSNIAAAEPVRSPHFTKKDKSSIEDQLLQKSGLEDKKSIRETVRKILSYMSDARITKVGVCGIGGIGKTAVLKDLISQPKTKDMFKNIILVTVSRYWSVRKIQNEVLRQLLCHKYPETDSQVAERVFQLLEGKKFLLILDDVWEQIDLKAVGIPNPTTKNGCKILMASRKLDVFHKMDVINVIEVEPIPWKEAMELFYEQLRGTTPDIQPFAESIVKGCFGLPLLIIVTGRALAQENDVSVWEYASRKFSLSRTTRVSQIEDVMQLLKFSFDQLKDDDVKSCFLHCALFSEDRQVSIFEFIDYCIQEGVVTGARGDAHKKGCDIVDILVHASLLQVTKYDNSIKMHDLIRDLALGILSSAAEDRLFLRAEGGQLLLRAYSRLKELSNPGSSSSFRSVNGPESSRLSAPEVHQFLLRVGAGLTEPPLEEEWKQANMIFLMDNDFHTLPERPSCPKLFTLFLQRNSQLRTIPSSFFDLMISLKVLNLSKTRISFLPNTLFKLKNLQILILQHCERLNMLPSEVGSLENLEVLDLHGSEIYKLPDKVGSLGSLRQLKASFYGSLDDSEYDNLPSNLISSGTISRLQGLETLSIVVYPGDERWYEDVKSVKSEISELRKLISLCFHFPEVEHIQQFLKESTPWKDQRLIEFKFVVGYDVESITSRVPDNVEFDYNRQVRCLRFVNGEKMPDEVLQVLARSTAFYLDHHLVVNNLFDFGFSNINGLKYCIISECPEIRTVVHVEEHTMAVFPRLENLSIHHLWNLTCIWEGIVPKGSFAELRTLSVYACPKLEYLFRSSMTQSLWKLEELEVKKCPAMEEIIVDCEIVDTGYIIFPGLKKLTLHSLPGLVNIWRSAWPSLEYISFYDCPKLKKIGIDSKLEHTIIKIEAEKIWWDALQWEDTKLRLDLEKHLTIILEDDV